MEAKLKRLIKNIKFIRETDGWSQEKLAEEAGISRSYLLQLEGGRNPRPSVWTISSIAKALNVDVDHLMNS